MTPPFRRARVALAACLAGVFHFSCGGGDGDTPTSPLPPGVKPNFVLVLTDDQDLATFELMPLVREKVGRAGLSFSNSFVTNPVCCPSRATLLTGQYSHNHGVLANEPPRGGFNKFYSEGRERDTVPFWLNRNGYYTGLVGKYLNRYPEGAPNTYIPPGWNEWAAIFSNRGSDAYFDYSLNDGGVIRNYGRNASDYITDVILNRSLEFLRRAENDDAKPFFLHVTPNAPHRPADPAPRHANALIGIRMPRTPNWNEADISDKPRWLRDFFTPITTPDGENVIDAFYQQRARSLLAVDEMVSGLIDELARLGELENTYFLFTSDNGFLMGSHRFFRGKDAPYEESIRVPLVVRGPGIRAGSTSDAFVLNNDLAPTLLDLAGVAIPASVDGRSLWPLLQGKKPSDWRTDFLIEHWSPQVDSQEDPESAAIPDYQGVRTDRYTYVEYVTGETELYDLRSDPYQLTSLHATAGTSIVNPLRNRLAALRNCAGASCR
jgi:arylsulfatase A-like enzyme